MNEIEALRQRVRELEDDKQRLMAMPTATEAARAIAYRDALAACEKERDEAEAFRKMAYEVS